MGFKVITVMLLKIEVLWSVTPRRRVSGYRRLEGTCYLHLQLQAVCCLTLIQALQ